MNHYGGANKSTSTFDSNKKGLKNKNDKNMFGTSSSNGKGKGLNGLKPATDGVDFPDPKCSWCCMSSGTADLNSENIEL